MLKSKTVIGALGAILAAVGGVMSGELEIGSAINVIVTSVLAIFLRHGVKKAENANSVAG